jgi:hypothetical protein
MRIFQIWLAIAVVMVAQATSILIIEILTPNIALLIPVLLLGLMAFLMRKVIGREMD